jgi:hypothetical protein
MDNPVLYNDPSGHCVGPGGHEFPDGSSACDAVGTGGEEDEAKAREQKYSAWELEVFYQLRNAGPNGIHAADYLFNNHVSFDNLSHQNGTGAAWQLNGTISFPDNPDHSLPSADDPITAALIAHEAKHLEQGPWDALSAYGELEAWQVGFRVGTILNNNVNPWGSYANKILDLPLSHNRLNLIRAVFLMERYENGPRLIGNNYPLGWLLLLSHP